MDYAVSALAYVTVAVILAIEAAGVLVFWIAATSRPTPLDSEMIHTPSDLDKVRDTALGTCLLEAEIAESLGLETEDVEAVLAESDIARCEVCSWWVEQSELVEKDDQEQCEDCANS